MGQNVIILTGWCDPIAKCSVIQNHNHFSRVFGLVQLNWENCGSETICWIQFCTWIKKTWIKKTNIKCWSRFGQRGRSWDLFVTFFTICVKYILFFTFSLFSQGINYGSWWIKTCEIRCDFINDVGWGKCHSEGMNLFKLLIGQTLIS